MNVDQDRLLDRLEQQRRSLLDGTWVALGLAFSVGLPMSLSRALVTGWLPVYSAQIAVAIVALVVIGLRKRLSYHCKLALLIGAMWTVGLLGMATMGLLGESMWWLFMSAILLLVFSTGRAAMAAVISIAVVFLVAAFAFVGGFLTLPFDADGYSRQPTSWLAAAVSLVALTLAVVKTLGSYQERILDLLAELEEQRDKSLRLATYDHLSGLPTLRLFDARLDRAVSDALRAGEPVALLYVDLDDFKAINDSFGHSAGDRVLKEVAARMAKITRHADTVARIGGDEFGVIVTDAGNRESVASVASRILSAVRAPMLVDEAELVVDASIGIAFCPEHACDAPSLRHAADQAMYRVKHPGNHGYAFADQTTSAVVLEAHARRFAG
ncbi:MAG TPA: diguanylate cyclase [Thermoanaerobaculia bacterium]|nr:diguanylate cyclase [Thermoanaerobaculia bacterium]